MCKSATDRLWKGNRVGLQRLFTSIWSTKNICKQCMTDNIYIFLGSKGRCYWNVPVHQSMAFIYLGTQSLRVTCHITIHEHTIHAIESVQPNLPMCTLENNLLPPPREKTLNKWQMTDSPDHVFYTPFFFVGAVCRFGLWVFSWEFLN